MVERKHHEHTANNLGVDASLLQQRAEGIDGKMGQLPLWWSTVHPVKNGQARRLFKAANVVGDMERILLAIATGNFKHLEGVQQAYTNETYELVGNVREKIAEAGIPIEEVSMLQLIEMLQLAEGEILDEAEETVFGKKED